MGWLARRRMRKTLQDPAARESLIEVLQQTFTGHMRTSVRESLSGLSGPLSELPPDELWESLEPQLRTSLKERFIHHLGVEAAVQMEDKLNEVIDATLAELRHEIVPPGAAGS